MTMIDAARAALEALSCTGESDDPGHRCGHCDDYVDRNGLVRDALRAAIEEAEKAQPARKPMTEEEIDAATGRESDALLDHIYEYGTLTEGVQQRIRAIARAIERHHGIGGEHE